MKLYNFNQWCSINEGALCKREEIESAETTLKKCNDILIKAIEFWKGWIGDSITRGKFKAAYGYTDDKVEEIFKGYQEAFSKISLVPYGRCTDGTPQGKKYTLPEGFNPAGAWAFVVPKGFKEHQYKIYINIPPLGNASNEFIEGLFVHEVQHVLYDLVHPLNPEIKLEKCFTTKDNRDPSTIRRFFSGIFGGWKTKSSKPKVAINADRAKKIIIETFSLDEEAANKVVNFLFDATFEQSQYALKNTEVFSRVITIRNMMGLKPGEDITLVHLKPTIDRIIAGTVKEDSVDWEIILILVNWYQQGAKVSILDLLNNLNQLAYQQGQTGATGVA